MLFDYFLYSLPLHTRYLESIRASDGAIAGVLAGAVSASGELAFWRVEKAHSLGVVPVFVVDRHPSIHPIFVGLV